MFYHEIADKSSITWSWFGGSLPVRSSPVWEGAAVSQSDPNHVQHPSSVNNTGRWNWFCQSDAVFHNAFLNESNTQDRTRFCNSTQKRLKGEKNPPVAAQNITASRTNGANISQESQTQCSHNIVIFLFT